MKKSDLDVGKTYWHKYRGLCKFTDQCAVIELSNPDPTSVFMEIYGDIDEVSLALISPFIGYDKREAP